MSTNKLQLELGGRFKIVRKSLDLTQAQMAEKLSIGLSSYQYYERGEREIPSGVIAQIVAFGVNAEWIVTGKGETYLVDQDCAESENPIILIGDIIEGLETVLQEEGTNLPPSKKRKLIELLYKRFEKTGENVTTEIVRDHLQLIAA